jgi:hypothetical protein
MYVNENMIPVKTTSGIGGGENDGRCEFKYDIFDT